MLAEVGAHAPLCTHSIIVTAQRASAKQGTTPSDLSGDLDLVEMKETIVNDSWTGSKRRASCCAADARMPVSAPYHGPAELQNARFGTMSPRTNNEKGKRIIVLVSDFSQMGRGV